MFASPTRSRFCLLTSIWDRIELPSIFLQSPERTTLTLSRSDDSKKLPLGTRSPRPFCCFLASYIAICSGVEVTAPGKVTAQIAGKLIAESFKHKPPLDRQRILPILSRLCAFACAAATVRNEAVIEQLALPFCEIGNVRQVAVRPGPAKHVVQRKKCGRATVAAVTMVVHPVVGTDLSPQFE